MATVPTAEQSARRLLSIFKTNNIRAGEVLMLGMVNTIFMQDFSYRGKDFEAGEKYAQEQGWLEFENGVVRLTQKGFDEL
jgi:hypothetical protein